MHGLSDMKRASLAQILTRVDAIRMVRRKGAGSGSSSAGPLSRPTLHVALTPNQTQRTCRIRPDVGEHRPEVGRDSPKSGRFWAFFGEHGAKSVELGHIWSKPPYVDWLQTQSAVDRRWPGVRQIWASLHQVWATSTDLGLMFAGSGMQQTGRIQPDVR